MQELVFDAYFHYTNRRICETRHWRHSECARQPIYFILGLHWLFFSSVAVYLTYLKKNDQIEQYCMLNYE